MEGEAVIEPLPPPESPKFGRLCGLVHYHNARVVPEFHTLDAVHAMLGARQEYKPRSTIAGLLSCDYQIFFENFNLIFLYWFSINIHLSIYEGQNLWIFNPKHLQKYIMTGI